MSVDWTNLTGAVATVIAAGAAVASWRAAKSSNRTSNLLAKIEKERRHAELRPVFSVRCEKYPNDDMGQKSPASLVRPTLLGGPALWSLRFTHWMDWDSRERSSLG